MMTGGEPVRTAADEFWFATRSTSSRDTALLDANATGEEPQESETSKRAGVRRLIWRYDLTPLESGKAKVTLTYDDQSEGK
jgi:hypothetical protein